MGRQASWNKSPFSSPLLEIEPHGVHIPGDLISRFLKIDIQTAFSAAARRIGEGRGQSGFAAACGAAEQDGGAAKIALSLEHFVQIRDAGGHTLAGYGVLQLQGSERQDGHSALVDQEWILVGSVLGSPVLHDAQAA